jgi:hypothetical protein
MIDFFVLVFVHMHHWCISMCGALEPSSYPPATSLPVDVIDHGAAYLPFAGGRLVHQSEYGLVTCCLGVTLKAHGSCPLSYYLLPSPCASVLHCLSSLSCCYLRKILHDVYELMRCLSLIKVQTSLVLICIVMRCALNLYLVNRSF